MDCKNDWVCNHHPDYHLVLDKFYMIRVQTFYTMALPFHREWFVTLFFKDQYLFTATIIRYMDIDFGKEITKAIGRLLEQAHDRTQFLRKLEDMKEIRKLDDNILIDNFMGGASYVL